LSWRTAFVGGHDSAAAFFNLALKDHFMNEKENTALVQQGYNLFSKGDIPGVLKLMSPNVTWELPKLDNVPFTGKFQGVEGVGRFFSALAGSLDILKFEPREFIAQGNKVVVLGESRYRVKERKEEFDDKWADVLTVENGKITSYQQFGDSAQLERAFKAK
jgi:ketosteroid isomerase-like protein